MRPLRSALFLLGLAVFLMPLVATAQTSVIVDDPVFKTAGDPIEGSSVPLLETFSTGLDQATQCRVISKNDVRDLMSFERMRQLMGSDAGNTGLAEELAGALGADTIVVWEIGRLGEVFVVNARALKNGRAVASAIARATSRAGTVGAAQQAGTAIGQKLKCPNPGADYLIYEVSISRSEHDVNEARAINSSGHAVRTDIIEMPNLLTTTGHVEVEQLEQSTIIAAPHLGQCTSPTGYQNLPSKVDYKTDILTHASADTEPSVTIEQQGGQIRIKGSVSESIPRTVTDRQQTSGILCGRASEPTDNTTTSGAVSMALEIANFDVLVPFDRLKAEHSGSKSWPFELNGWKGTAKLTWKLKSLVR